MSWGRWALGLGDGVGFVDSADVGKADDFVALCPRVISPHPVNPTTAALTDRTPRAPGVHVGCQDVAMELQEIQTSARLVRERYAAYEEQQYGRSWTPSEIMLGLVGDVGDLAKLVQGKGGVRHTPDIDAKLAHELADCLWAILTLADSYDVDIERSFTDTMAELHAWLDARS
jgi:NTP pyrophosphatase (non-canonical NTP hydrolase)